MTTYEDENFVVKPSHIEGYGLFAKRQFKKGEVVLVWKPTRLTKEELDGVSLDQKKYVNTLEDGTPALMNVPERYVNHSDNPNTKMLGNKDIAIKEIQVGEEITSSYLCYNSLMKNITIIVLALLGIYFLVMHTGPLSHESFGLYNHNIHNTVGVVLLLVAGFMFWKGRK